MVGLQWEQQKEYVEEHEIEYEVFPEPQPVVIKKKVEGEEDEEEPPAEADDGEEKK